MAALTSLQTDTLEEALLEIATRLQLAEAAKTPPSDNVSVTIDFDNLEATITATLPVTLTPSADGVRVAAREYA